MYLFGYDCRFNSRAAGELLFIIFLSDCCSLASSEAGSKIIEGRYARRGEFPATVVFEGAKKCGGTLVTLSKVLTAGRCFFADDKPVEAKSIKVTGGILNLKENSNEKQQSLLKSYQVHEKYKSAPTDQIPYIFFDIALAVLETPFVKTDTVQPAVFPAKDPGGMRKILDKILAENKTCQATGYGATKEGGTDVDTLKVAKVYLVDSTACRLREESLAYEVCTTPTNGQDRTAPGDTGSTFLCDGYILGMNKGRNKMTRNGVEYHFMICTLIGPFMDYFKLGIDEGQTSQLHPAVFLFLLIISFHEVDALFLSTTIAVLPKLSSSENFSNKSKTRGTKPITNSSNRTKTTLPAFLEASSKIAHL
ncbi:plasma kallikrein-like [Cimex lectularius]|uniref:Peptidase S1 domain-containing protein n=1 Tax=Cimex lectularius TaxID=79782 RepID=A0A8I6TFE5_CIMLE|nr:plasma kallikrein-like [Cimex lectularius]